MVSNTVRLTSAGSASIWPKSGLTVAARVNAFDRPYLTSAPTPKRPSIGSWNGSAYTGITGLNTQDYAVQEGMGPIVDRSREHLGSSDKAIIAARRLLLDSLKTIKEGHPPAGSDPEDCRGVRPAEAIIKADEHWRDAMADLLEARW